MEIQEHSGFVELNSVFDEIYNWLLQAEQKDLATEEGTPFSAVAGVVKKGDRKEEGVIKFFQKKDAKLKEYGRTHKCCWGKYYNCNRTRIGMYCRALDNFFGYSWDVVGLLKI